MKTIKSLGMVIVISTLLFFTGCGTYLNVYSDHDTSVDFTKYRTYTWFVDKDQTNSIYNNPVIRNNLRNYVNTALASRNFREQETNPDVYIDLTMVNELPPLSVAPPPFYWSSSVG